MTEIRPFRAVHYNKEKIDDMTKVVCPPYDVISKEQQEEFYSLHPNNFIRVMLTKDSPKDNDQDNKYTRAKTTFEDWLRDNVFLQDEKPGIYFYKQEYKIMGQRYNRIGFIALMKLQEPGNETIFPHEKTHDAAKEDRYKLWSSLQSNLSPIFVCFSDKDKKVESVYAKTVSDSEPLVDVQDSDGVRHTLWVANDEALVKEVVGTLDDQQLFIADGHHRYEVAKRYRDSKSKAKSKLNGEASHNFVMTYFTNIDSKDLQIFPMHRIITKFEGSLDFLEDYFRIDKIKNKEDLAIMLAKAGQNEYAFGMYTKDGILLLRLKNKLLIDKNIKEGSKEYRHLDATILKSFIFDRVGVISDDIIYTKDMSEVFDKVDQGKADAGFTMNPVKIEQLKAIALNGERMPPKTTYFYPKVLSGLTVYKMD